MMTRRRRAMTARETRESATESAEPLEMNECFNECFNARARARMNE